MLRMIDEGKALNISSKYFDILSSTGYMKHSNVLRFLIYLFIVDFVGYTHMFFSESDYDIVSKALGILFADGGCLMPYPIMCANRAKLGRNEYMGTMKIRKTEDLSSYIDRYTEDEYHRTV